MRALAGSPLLKALESKGLISNRLGDQGASELAGSAHAERCQELDLCSNEIGEKGAAAIAAGRLSSLRKLLIWDNPLGDDGLRRLAQGLPALQELVVMRCGVKAGALVEVLESGVWPKLERLAHEGPVNGLVVRAGLQRGVRLEIQQDAHLSLLRAAEKGDANEVRSLLASELHLGVTDSKGKSPLWLAASAGSLECLELLLNAGADVHQPSGQGNAPVWIAAKKGWVPVVERLAKAGARLEGLVAIAPPAAGAHLRKFGAT